ncbi:MAG: efflux RND transporter permease subunit, partial [Spirochaetes bacterium]|nr:efflux RND transporter permease subunit [Spirochaetota bacterium]
MIRWFIERKITTAMMFLCISLIGTIAAMRLPIQLLPNIEFPTLTVITPYPHAVPIEVEKLVTKRIEEAVSSVTGVRDLCSESIEGLSLVTARFSWNTNMDFALIEAKEKVDMIKGSLPEEAEKSIVVKYDPQSEPSMIFAVKSQQIEFKKLRRILEREIIPLLERTHGVAMVEAYGGFKRQINVEADSDKMAARGVSFEDIVKAISAANYNFPAGNIEIGNKEYEVRTIGEFSTPRDINSVVVGQSDSGIPIYLSQIARVIDGWKEQKSIVRFDGENSIGLFITREGGKNAIETSREVREKLREISKKFHNKMSFHEVFNEANFISQSIANVRNAAILGALITICILLLFLSQPNAAFIVAFTIPISILTTFALMYAKGMTINSMSLGGLALGIGMTVDASIVVMESIEHVRSHAKHKRLEINSIVTAVKEVKTSVVASILTTLVVFLPIVFLSGIAGALFSELALTISFSLLASLITSLLLVPMLASIACNNRIIFPEALSRIHQRVHKISDECLKALSCWYESLLGYAMKEKKRLLAIGLFIAIVGSILTVSLNRELMPKIDSGEFTIDIQAPRGSSLAETLKIAQAVEKEVQKSPYVVHVFSKIGCDPDDSISERLSGKMRDFATIRVILTDSSRPHLLTIIDDLRNRISIPDGVQLDCKAKEDIVQSVLASKSSAITIELSGQNLDMLKKAGDALKERLLKIPSISAIATSLDGGNPEIRLALDRTKSFAYGLTVADVAQTLQCAIGGSTATTFREGDDEVDVRVRLCEEFRNNLDKLSSIYVKTAQGHMFALKSCAQFSPSISPTRITR